MPAMQGKRSRPNARCPKPGMRPGPACPAMPGNAGLPGPAAAGPRTARARPARPLPGPANGQAGTCPAWPARKPDGPAQLCPKLPGRLPRPQIPKAASGQRQSLANPALRPGGRGRCRQRSRGPMPGGAASPAPGRLPPGARWRGQSRSKAQRLNAIGPTPLPEQLTPGTRIARLMLANLERPSNNPGAKLPAQPVPGKLAGWEARLARTIN